MAKESDRLANIVKQLGTILSVWAHPDDESFLAAGLLAIAAANGQTVICVTATKGEAGSHDEQKWPSKTIGQVRATELKRALQIIGVNHHHWLGYHDGQCAKVPMREGVERVAHFIDHYQPDTIVTFGPQGWTGHTDHITVSKWVKGAVGAKKRPAVYHVANSAEQYNRYFKQIDDKFNIIFNLDRPPLVSVKHCDMVLHLPTKVCRLKYEALAVQSSQTEGIVELFGRDFLQKAVATEAFVRAKSGET